ncbi:UNVERIFIED_CONTAM: hypothetical protein NCL1_20896 [Trichonephila clavipes]
MNTYPTEQALILIFIQKYEYIKAKIHPTTQSCPICLPESFRIIKRFTNKNINYIEIQLSFCGLGN